MSDLKEDCPCVVCGNPMYSSFHHCDEWDVEAIKEIESIRGEIQDAWEKIHALEDDLHNTETENDSLKDKVKALTRTNDRVYEELTTAIELMGIIYNKADLNFDYKGHNIRETIKDYLGV